MPDISELLGSGRDPASGYPTFGTLDYGERGASGSQVVGSGVWSSLNFDTATITSPDPVGSQIVNSANLLQIIHPGIYFAYCKCPSDPAAGTGGRGLTIIKQTLPSQNMLQVAFDFRAANAGTLGSPGVGTIGGMFAVTTAEVSGGGSVIVQAYYYQDNGGAITLPSSLALSTSAPGFSPRKLGVFRIA